MSHIEKPRVKTFFSYAHRNTKLKVKLMEPLMEHLSVSKFFTFERWHDVQILPGEHWHHEIKAAIAKADIGIVLLSPAFFSSEYIRIHEIPELLTKSLGVIPVLLEPLDFSNMDLNEFNDLQVFTLNRKAFAEMRGHAQQTIFVHHLFQSINQVAKKRLDKKQEG
jgi:TIR domain